MIRAIRLRLTDFLRIGRYPIDLPLLYTVFILLFLGLSIMYSGSSVTAEREFEDSMYFFKKQFLWMSIGFLLFTIIVSIPYRLYQKYASQIILLSIVLLALVFIPGIGKSVGTYYGRNFHRWINLGSFQVQPSEFAKIAVVCYLSSFLVKKSSWEVMEYGKFLFPGVVIGSVIGLIIIEPAFGTTLEILAVIIALIFIDGFPIQRLIFGFLASLPLLFILIYRVGYRKKRIEVWLDPYKYKWSEGHQLVSSFKAFADGGWLGNQISTGYSHRYLTYSHTDFVMATFAEDYGYMGFLFIFSLFLFLVVRGYMLVRRVGDYYGFLLGVGLVTLIGVQILINLFVVTGIFPVTGISLPFLSYGGSSLLTIMMSLAILLNITRRENIS